MTASYGGTRDELIGEYNLRSAIVVENEEEANKLGLEIDHDDSIAISNGPSFALLIHGPQPKGGKIKPPRLMVIIVRNKLVTNR